VCANAPNGPSPCAHTGLVEFFAALTLEAWENAWNYRDCIGYLVGLGLVSSYTMGGFIHILLVLAVIMIAVRLIQGRGV
jgi:hypothetical protein